MYLCIRVPSSATLLALPHPPARYQHLSTAYSPVTTETQRERQKGLTCQVFEQDTSGDERMGPEDTVRGHWLGLLRARTQESALLALILMSEIDPRTEVMIPRIYQVLAVCIPKACAPFIQ